MCIKKIPCKMAENSIISLTCTYIFIHKGEVYLNKMKTNTSTRKL